MTTPQSPPPPPPPPAVPPGTPPPVAEPQSAAEPPRGPGVVVPFAAPPRDRDHRRPLVASLVGGALALVVLLALVAGTVGVLVWSSAEMSERAADSAEKFLDEIVDGDYDKAYAALCPTRRANLSEEEFTSEWQSVGVESYRLGKTTTAKNGDPVVPAELRQGGHSRNVDLAMALEPQTMKMAVCDW